MKISEFLILAVLTIIIFSCKSSAPVVYVGLLEKNDTMTEKALDKRGMIDSLKHVIYRDTAKFNEKDLVFTQIGRRNVNSYSMLYIVNGTFLYMLDIISSDKVIEFVNEFLDTDKIEDIGIMPKEKSPMFGGKRAKNGIVVIKLKRNLKFNPFVAGLEKAGKNGDNFSRRRDNELMIRE